VHGDPVNRVLRGVLDRDPILWGAVGFALASTAYAEYNLAVVLGANEYIAVAVPGALDLYVLRALQVRRDVFLAVLAMVAANVTWYLVHSGDVAITWQLRSAVGALAPLILWRVHSLKYTRTRTELLWGLPRPAESTEPSTDAGAVSAPEEYTPALAWTPGYHLDGCDGVHPLEGPANCIARAGELDAAEEYTPSAPEYVPQEWADQEDKRRRHTDAPAPVYPPYLTPVPDLPSTPEYTPDPDECAVSTGLLLAEDLEYVPSAREYMHSAERPSARGLRGHVGGIGQERAKRLFQHLKGERQ
jgi:hypothetical protein